MTFRSAEFSSKSHVHYCQPRHAAVIDISQKLICKVPDIHGTDRGLGGLVAVLNHGCGRQMSLHDFQHDVVQ